MPNRIIHGFEAIGETVLTATSKIAKDIAPGYRATRPLDKSLRTAAGEHYLLHLEPLEQEYEEARSSAYQEMQFRLTSAVLICTAVCFFAYAFWQFAVAAGWLGSRNSSGLLSYTAIGAVLLAGFWVYAPVARFSRIVRDELYPRIFSFFGNDFRYHTEAPDELAKAVEVSSLAPYHTQFKVDDYISGSRNGVGIELADIQLTKPGSKGRTKTVFKGLCIVLTPVRRFNGRIIIDQDEGLIANNLNRAFGTDRSSLQRIRLEDPEFERHFEVYADDQITARTVLTTSFMERLTGLKWSLRLMKLSCSFFNGKILFLLPTGEDHFPTPSLFEPLNLAKQMQNVISEMQLIFQIIEDLRLDQDIGL